MTVLVDDCVWPWRGRRWCHLVSDASYDELHTFAAAIGVVRRSFQGDHYDVDERVRAVAVAAGAHEVGGRELLRRLRDAGLRASRSEKDAERHRARTLPFATADVQAFQRDAGQASPSRLDPLDLLDPPDPRDAARWSDPRDPAAVLLELAYRHEEPHRRYHGTAHVTHVLASLQELSGAPALLATHDREALIDAAPDIPPRAARLRMAAWFHDAVYDPQRSDNEARSAELAEERLALLGWPDDARRRVGELVLATRTHEPDDEEGALLCTADLAVLAAPPDAYAHYAASVRAEYAHVADDAWRNGRSAFLSGVLQRPRIFPLAGLDVWEASARRNLHNELHGLRA